jgi:hypothetical protein
MSVSLTIDGHSHRWAAKRTKSRVPISTQGYVAALFFLTLGCILPFVLLNSLHHWEYDSSVAIAFATTLYSAGRLAAFAARDERRLLWLTFWVFVYVFLGLTALLQIASRIFPYSMFYVDSVAFTAELIVVLGLVGYEVGYASGFTLHHPAVRTIRGILSGYSVSLSHLMMLSAGAVMVSLAIVFTTGGINTLLQPRTQMIADFKGSIEGEGSVKLEFFRNLMQLSPAIAAYISWAWITHGRRLGHRAGIGTYSMFMLVLSVALLTCNPINGSRYLFASLTVAAWFATIRSRPNFGAISVVVLVAALIWLYPALSQLRESEGDPLFGGIGIAATTERMTTNFDFDGFRSIIDGVTYVEDKGVAWGRQFLGVLTFWYPREYWPHKPEPTGVLVSRQVGYSFTNISAPLWEDAYVDWGMPGVFIIFLLYGWGSGVLDAWHEGRPTDTSLGGILITYLAGYQFFTLRGDLWAAVSYLLPALLLFAVAFQRGRAQRRGPLHEDFTHKGH